jgi:hypothetical protein
MLEIPDLYRKGRQGRKGNQHHFLPLIFAEEH